MSPPQEEKANCLVERAASKITEIVKPSEDGISTVNDITIASGRKIENKPKNSELKIHNKENVKCNSAESKPDPNSKVSRDDIKLKQNSKVQKTHRKKFGRSELTSPTEFFHMGSLKSHAMAGKTQSANKLAGNNSQLMADLLGKGSPDPEIQKRKDKDQTSVEELSESLEKKVTIKEDTSEDLIDRGPVRAAKSAASYGPYPQVRNPQVHVRNGQQQLLIPSPVSPQQHWQSQKNKAKPNYQPHHFYSYDRNGENERLVHCNNENSSYNNYCQRYVDGNWEEGQQVFISTGGDLFNQGYAVPSYTLRQTSNPCLNSPANTFSPSSIHDDKTPSSCAGLGQNTEEKVATNPFADGVLNNEELSRLLNVSEELPEALSDFILKYSRRYSTDTPPISWTPDSGEESQPSSRKNSASDSSTSGSPRHHLSGFRPRSATDESSICDSPMSAGSAPQSSPAGPKGGQTPGTPTSLKQALMGAPPSNNSTNGNRYKPILPKQFQWTRKGKARDRLLSMFTESQKEAAWIWAMKCIQSCPGALYYRDPDGDRDLAKVYALVEQMLKTEYTPCRKPFDMPNRFHETPLFLAVEKRAEEVVSYLLECGANPNFQTGRVELDGPLHYAAARGMVEIVQALCFSETTDKNLRNGLGLTPLLCAVKNHGVIEEESQCLVNNKPTIRALLKAGADPKIPDATNGKTVLHYSVERMDPELVEIFSDSVNKDEMRHLVNLPSYSGETVTYLLGRMGTGPRTGTGFDRFEAEDELRRKMFMTLIICGAEVTPSTGPAAGREYCITGDSTSPFRALEN